MNNDINFMTSTNLDELLEEHKKITHPYKKYEFDSTSYNLLLCDINKVLKENTNLKQSLNEIRGKIRTLGKFDGEKCTIGFSLWSADFNDILQIIDKVLGDEK